MQYEIRIHDLEDGQRMQVLAPTGSKSFIDKLIEAPKSQSRLIKITKMAQRVAEAGVGWAITAQKLKLLEDDLALYELKIGNTTLRIMTYLHNQTQPIYLFDFEGHQGKTGQIPQGCMKRGRTLAKAARECMQKEEVQSE